jgi:hypothetical protein
MFPEFAQRPRPIEVLDGAMAISGQKCVSRKPTSAGVMLSPDEVYHNLQDLGFRFVGFRVLEVFSVNRC